jgi:hypothetical protein
LLRGIAQTHRSTLQVLLKGVDAPKYIATRSFHVFWCTIVVETGSPFVVDRYNQIFVARCLQMADTDTLIPDRIVCAEFGIVSMTLWRWDHDPDLGFPPAVYIRKRKFRSRRLLDAFKHRMMRQAIRKERTA